jgi:hypothetical protein
MQGHYRYDVQVGEWTVWDKDGFVMVKIRAHSKSQIADESEAFLTPVKKDNTLELSAEKNNLYLHKMILKLKN